MSTVTTGTTGPERHSRGTADSAIRAARRRYAQVLSVLFIQAALLFVSSGRLDWVMAWAYLAVFVVVLGVNAAVLSRANPDLIAERGRMGPGVKPWDRLLAPLVSVAGPLAALVVAGLDVRFGWSPPFPPTLNVIAGAAVLLGYALTSWAMASNRFFSGFVRIQAERGHTVVSVGPYAYVRHPGYVGIALFTLAIPLLLGSLWGLVPAGLTVAALVVRTALEDATLQRELTGYSDFAARVRYRLIPGVW